MGEQAHVRHQSRGGDVEEFTRRAVKLEERPRSAPRGVFGDLGERLARAFSPPERPTTPVRASVALEAPRDDAPVDWDGAMPRFPIVRHGYDCRAVEEYVVELEREVVELERELAEVQERTPPRHKVEDEIHRIGEQTSSILVAAYDQARRTTQEAQVEADRCIAAAASNAAAMTADASRQLRELEMHAASVLDERARLIDDIRDVASSLLSVANAASERFPAEGDEGLPTEAVEMPMVEADEVPEQEHADSEPIDT
jgi:cell division septum initiation protein DivIVA